MRKKYQFKKIGHAGTLDPLACGVMIVLTDKDTKVQDQYMKLDKIYQAEVILGAITPSLDLETQISYDEDFEFKTKSQVEQVLKNLVGEIEMPVPIYSAKKISGKRLYKWARSGDTELELPVIKSKIYEIDLISLEEIVLEGRTLQKITCEIKCESGTYIRSLAKLIGERLGTEAFLFHLIRTAVGDFQLKDSQKFDELKLV